MLHIFSLLMMAAPEAQAEEVNAAGNFGIGVQAGSPLTFTGKYYMSEGTGVGFHVGGFIGYAHARVQFEKEFVEFADWDFARFPMYWCIGGNFDGYFASRWFWPGVQGGVGVELQFHDFPLQVFVETTPAIKIPMGAFDSGYIWGAWLDWYGGAGVRYYF